MIRMTRREALRAGLLGTGSLVLSRLGARAAARPARAKSVIQIWMWGGPSHLDTFDPKPGAGYDYCGPLAQPIATNVDGVQIGELLPLLAKQADKYSLIRSLTHGINAHETATYAVQTGRKAGERLVYPGVGAVVSFFRGYRSGYRGLIPPYIALTQPQGRFSESGFLGAGCAPFATGGDPAQGRFAVEGIVLPGVTDQRQRSRRELLHRLDTLRQALPEDENLKAFDEAERQAYELILGDGAEVFNLSKESDDLRVRYGRNTFGQSCLAARRLVERGVPYITINFQGWDTHRQNFQTMRRLLPDLDKGLTTLLGDLADRGLLASTVVWAGGEFGRTPKVMWEEPWNGGRNHHGEVFSALVAGGGFKGGHIVGASDERGEEVRDRPVSAADLIGSIYELLGIDTDSRLPNPLGMDAPVIAPAEGVRTNGKLREIMA
jgi:hypothetical protein